jgi:hypothetical protein
MRRGGGSYVIVGGFAIEEQVADAAADKVSGVSMLSQRARDAGGFNRFGRREVHVFQG